MRVQAGKRGRGWKGERRQGIRMGGEKGRGRDDKANIFHPCFFVLVCVFLNWFVS